MIWPKEVYFGNQNSTLGSVVPLAMFIVHYVIIGTWEENKLEKWKIVELKSKRLQGDGSCAKGLRRKVWTRTKNLSPNIRYFVALLRFVAIYVLFRTRKKCFFWSKKVLLGQEVHYYMEYIAYYADKNLQICNLSWKRKNAQDKILYGHFALAERLPTSATLQKTTHASLNCAICVS